MENKLERRYGLFTAICMVVGTVCGSGVFFKAQTILQKAEGSLTLGLVAWLIGGAITLICTLAFANMAQKYEKVNGIVDYAEATVGPRYGYYIGWFMAVIYTPTLTGLLAWLSARYLLTFMYSVNPALPLLIPAAEGGLVCGPECMCFTLLFLCIAFAVNALSPKLAGKLQVSTTVIKFIPLTLMAVVGIIYGLANGALTANVAAVPFGATSSTGGNLLAGVCATSFAYEGWILATSINSELKNSKRNLPRALVIGILVVIATYSLYYLGVAGGASAQQLMDEGATTAFTNVFGNVLGNILNLFVSISCMGTLNGLMLACCRNVYALAARDQGPSPRMFRQVDSESKMAHNSAILGLVLAAAWFLYFFLCCVAGTWNGAVAFRGTPFESVILSFDPTELPIITTYAMYIPIFIQWMRKRDDVGFAGRYLIPGLAICGSLFMIYACAISHRMGCVWYLVIFAAFMLLGRLFAKKKNA